MTAVDDLDLAPLAGDLGRVQDLLDATVSEPDRLIGDAAGHLLAAGGKRLRPALTLCAAYATKGIDVADDAAIVGGAAVELVHLGSLYHDDVIDEADTRRGVPSVNARWSNVVAILTGDFLLARASELAASLGADVAGLLARTISELCRGQVLELEHLYDADRTEESYISSIEGKTASLMATAARIGGLVSGAEGSALESLTSFGHHLGMCFQMIDDILDLTRTDAELGKPAGNDLVEGVYTLPVIRAAKERPELRSLLGGPLEHAELEQALALVGAPEFVEVAKREARNRADRAIESLAVASGLDTEVTGRMQNLVAGLLTRSF